MLHHKGFTLIELIMVIVILGILAATALPKFADLSKDARIASLEMLQGQLQDVASAWYAYSKLKGCTDNSSNFNVTNNSVTAKLTGCYPEAGNVTAGTEIDALINTTGFTVTASSDTAHTYFDIPGAPNPSTCRVDYRQALPGAYPMSISVITAGC